MDIISLIQNCIFQLIVGFLFISIFNFVSLKRNTKDVEHLILSSFAVGFIIVQLFNMLPFSIGKVGDSITVCLTTIIVAYCTGKIFASEMLTWLLEKLKIRQSLQSNTWAELMDTEKSMKLNLTLKDGTAYYGYVSYISEDKDPLIALAAYKVNDGDIVLENNKLLLINTGDLKHAEIIYNPNSKKCKKITAYVNVVRRRLESESN